MTDPTAYFAGRFVPDSEIRISPTDAGFVQGTTVSEQLRTFRGKLFRLDEHWARLRRSLEIVGTRPAETLADLSFAAEQVAKHNHALLTAGDDLGVVVAITPGSSPAFARIARQGPQAIIHSYPLPYANWYESYRSGVRLRVAPNVQVPETSWPAELKCRSRMHYHLADRWAAEQEPGARALLLNLDGTVNETSTANVLGLRGRTLVGPPGDTILRGVSLAATIEYGRSLGYDYQERALNVEELFTCDELFLTSTPFCLLPVVAVDGRSIGAGRPGIGFGELIAAWSAATGIDVVGQARRGVAW